MIHLFQQSHTFSSKAAPPNYATSYVFMKNKYIQTTTEKMVLFCNMVSECTVQGSFAYACQEAISEETLNLIVLRNFSQRMDTGGQT